MNLFISNVDAKHLTVLMITERIATLIAWCSDNNVKIDPRIQLRGCGDDIAVFSVNVYIDNQVSRKCARLESPKRLTHSH
jgi:hypothetical protein